MWPFKSRSSLSDSSSLKEKIIEIIKDERKLAKEHLNDPYYTDMMTGHNIGEDEELAVKYAEIAFKAANDLEDKNQFINKFIGELLNQKNVFRRVCEDPDGFGIVTLHDVERRAKDKAGEFGINSSNIQPEEGAGSIYDAFPETMSSLDFDNEISSSLHISKILLKEERYLLAFDALQVHMMQLATRLYILFKGERGAEIAIYASRLKVAQTLLLESLIKSRMPKIVTNPLWGYVFGCNSVLTYVESSKKNNNYTIQECGKQLPLTIFDLDLDLAMSNFDESSSVQIYDESTPHKIIYQGLEAVHEVLDEEGMGFIHGMFLKREEILELIQPGTSVVGYFNHSNVSSDWEVEDALTEITSICLKNTGADYLKVAVARVGRIDKIDHLIGELNESITHAISFGDRSDGELNRKLEEISYYLYDPYDEFLENCDATAFLTEGNLSLVPFSALLNTSREHLIYKKNVSLISNIRGLRNSTLKLNDYDKGLVVYSPDYCNGGHCESGETPFRQLPYSDKEGREIISLTNWEALSGESATYQNFARQLENKSIFHVSTHGGFDGDVVSLKLFEGKLNPAMYFSHFSSMEKKGFFSLAGANNDVLHSKVYSEHLNKITFQNIKLAYLSLCIGGAGDAVEGDGIYGISRALKVGGVSCVISNPYPIVDKNSYEVALSFYRNILAGCTFLEALRSSQLERANNGEEWFHWAGYSAYL